MAPTISDTNGGKDATLLALVHIFSPFDTNNHDRHHEEVYSSSTMTIRWIDVVCISNVTNFLLPQPGNELLFHNVQSQFTVFQKCKTISNEFKKLCECIWVSLTAATGSQFILINNETANSSSGQITIMAKAQALIAIATCFIKMHDDMNDEKERSMTPDTIIPSGLTVSIEQSLRISSLSENDEMPLADDKKTAPATLAPLSLSSSIPSPDEESAIQHDSEMHSSLERQSWPDSFDPALVDTAAAAAAAAAAADHDEFQDLESLIGIWTEDSNELDLLHGELLDLDLKLLNDSYDDDGTGQSDQ